MAIYATGAAELRHVAELCRTAVDISGVTQELMGAEPKIAAAVKSNVISVLPHRGGLGAWVAEANIRLTPRRGGATVRVGKAGHDLQGLDDGLVIHPFYGRGPWFDQPVLPNSISDPIRDEGGDQLEQALIAVADRAVEKIAHG